MNGFELGRALNAFKGKMAVGLAKQIQNDARNEAFVESTEAQENASSFPDIADGIHVEVSSTDNGFSVSVSYDDEIEGKGPKEYLQHYANNKEEVRRLGNSAHDQEFSQWERGVLEENIEKRINAKVESYAQILVDSLSADLAEDISKQIAANLQGGGSQ